jgi:hypothetical protein
LRPTLRAVGNLLLKPYFNKSGLKSNTERALRAAH